MLLTLEDLKPGRRVARIYPHISSEPWFFTVDSEPFLVGSVNPPFGENWKVTLVSESYGRSHDYFLSDLGVIPRHYGNWGTNFVVWRSHAEFAGRLVQGDPRVQATRDATSFGSEGWHSKSGCRNVYVS